MRHCSARYMLTIEFVGFDTSEDPLAMQLIRANVEPQTTATALQSNPLFMPV